MKFALAGNPNSGKTTLFNNLTGSSAHVGNWAGVTVDKKTGIYKKLPEPAEVIDLPGIYSLSPYSPEEVISRKFLLEDKPDCIINIVDATNIERNLYLTTQILEINIPVVIALNMMDEVEKNGGKIDAGKLSETLNVPVIEISALKGKGLNELMNTAYSAAKEKRAGASVLSSGNAGKLFDRVCALYKENNVDNAVFKAVKMIENDELETAAYPEIARSVQRLKAETDTKGFEGDFEALIADARYSYITENITSLFIKPAINKNIDKSAKIDKVLTHRIFGIPLFLLIMFAVFHFTFSENFLGIGFFIREGAFDIPVIGKDTVNSPGVMLFNALELFTGWLGGLIQNAMPEGTWYTSLVCDGILGGLFAVLSFIPQIMVLFLFISILEESGYMSRVAFIMDKLLRKFGLSGKAFMPLIMCFGCAVPGIMATRTLEDDSERKRVIMIAPFFSCGAKLPVWAAFAGVFAQNYSSLNAEAIVFSMYLLGILIAVMSSLLLKRTMVKGKTPPFIMELPVYHAPRFKNVILYLWDKLKHFLFRAATVIAGSLIVIWFLSSFSFSFRFVTDSGDSIIGIIAKGLRYLFIPLGFGIGADGWKFVVAAITGLIAKEMIVGTMGTFAGFSDGGEIAGTALGAMMLSIGGSLGGYSMAVPAMFAFMAFNLLNMPCIAAVAAARGELRRTKSLWLAIGFWTITAYAVSAVIFWYGAFITVCWWAALITGLLLIGTIIIFLVLKYIIKPKRKRLKKEEGITEITNKSQD